MFEVIFVFLLALIIDILWVFYTKYVGQDRALLAAIFGTLIYASGAFVTLSWIANIYMIIPSLLGAFIGTLLAVKYFK